MGEKVRMKTKPEPLNGKRLIVDERINGIIYFEEDIKSACEFYLRYKDKPESLIKEHLEYEKVKIWIYKNDPTYVDEAKTIREIIEEIEWDNDLGDVNIFHMEKYNDWLFKLAFKDVLEEEWKKELK